MEHSTLTALSELVLVILRQTLTRYRVCLVGQISPFAVCGGAINIDPGTAGLDLGGLLG